MTTIVDAPPSSDTSRKAPTEAVAQFAPHVLRDRAKTSKTPPGTARPVTICWNVNCDVRWRP
jgi:hypothetical protein